MICADVEAGDLHARLLDEAGGVVEECTRRDSPGCRRCPWRRSGSARKPSSAIDDRGDADLDRRRRRLHRCTARPRPRSSFLGRSSPARRASRTSRCPTSRRTRARTAARERLNLVGRAATRRSCPRRASRCGRAMRKVDAMSWLMTTLVTPVSFEMSRIMSSTFLVATGSRPVVGSSYNRICGFEHERARQADALAHAARQLGRELLLDVAQPERVQPLDRRARGSPPSISWCARPRGKPHSPRR